MACMVKIAPHLVCLVKVRPSNIMLSISGLKIQGKGTLHVWF